MDLQPLLDFAASVAYRAGRITLGYFNTGIRPDVKADDTPVTAADRAAEEFIRGEIERAYPEHAIVGEEFGEKHGAGSRFRWIIDPIDGTKSFLRGIPLYAVLIGLEVDGCIRVGASYCPPLDEMLCAAEGLGAWWNGRRARVSDVDSLEQACICYTSTRNFERRDPALWGRLSSSAYLLRGWSDAYGYMAAATGRAEACLDPYMNLWDCGPFPVIFREAGGFFGSWDGEEGAEFGEALACNAALKAEMVRLLGDGRGRNSG